MGVGTGIKKMANSVAAANDDSIGGRIKSYPERIKSFYNDVRTEMRKVTAPSRKEVRATTTVVLIAVFIFAFYFWAVDNTLGRGVTELIQYLSRK